MIPRPRRYPMHPRHQTLHVAYGPPVDIQALVEAVRTYGKRAGLARIAPGTAFHGPNGPETDHSGPEIENAIPHPTEEA